MREHGATPATIAVLGGVPHVGLTAEQLRRIAVGCARPCRAHLRGGGEAGEGQL